MEHDEEEGYNMMLWKLKRSYYWMHCHVSVTSQENKMFLFIQIFSERIAIWMHCNDYYLLIAYTCRSFIGWVNAPNSIFASYFGFDVNRTQFDRGTNGTWNHKSWNEYINRGTNGTWDHKHGIESYKYLYGIASEISYVHQVQLKKYVPQTITFKSKTVEIFGEQRFNFQLQVSELFHLLYNE